jgi:hypothetical protein
LAGLQSANSRSSGPVSLSHKAGLQCHRAALDLTGWLVIAVREAIIFRFGASFQNL